MSLKLFLVIGKLFPALAFRADFRNKQAAVNKYAEQGGTSKRQHASSGKQTSPRYKNDGERGQGSHRKLESNQSRPAKPLQAPRRHRIALIGASVAIEQKQGQGQIAQVHEGEQP